MSITYWVKELYIVWCCPVCKETQGYAFSGDEETLSVTCDHNGQFPATSYRVVFDGTVGVSIEIEEASA